MGSSKEGKLTKKLLIGGAIVAGAAGLGYYYFANNTNESDNDKESKEKSRDDLEVPTTPIGTDFIFEDIVTPQDQEEIEFPDEEENEGENKKLNESTPGTPSRRKKKGWRTIQYKYENKYIGLELQLPNSLQINKEPKMGTDMNTIIELNSLLQHENDSNIVRTVSITPSRGPIPVESYIKHSITQYEKIKDNVEVLRNEATTVDGKEAREVILNVPSAFGLEKNIFFVVVCMKRKIVTFTHETNAKPLTEMEKELATTRQLIKKATLSEALTRGVIRYTGSRGLSVEIPVEFMSEDVSDNDSEGLIFAASNHRDDHVLQSRIAIITKPHNGISLRDTVKNLMNQLEMDNVADLSLSPENLTLKNLDTVAKLFTYTSTSGNDTKENQNVLCAVFNYKANFYQFIVRGISFDRNVALNILKTIELSDHESGDTSFHYTLPNIMSISLPDPQSVYISEHLSEASMVTFRSIHHETQIRKVEIDGKTAEIGLQKYDVANTKSIYHPSQRQDVVTTKYQEYPAISFSTKSYPNTDNEIVHFVTMIAISGEEAFLIETMVLRAYLNQEETELKNQFQTIHDSFEVLEEAKSE